MTTNHHTAISTGAAANASTINGPLGELDSAITDIDFTYSGVGTEYLDGDGNFSVPTGTGASVDGHGIKDEGGATLTQRQYLDFIGASVVAADGVSATEVTINGAIWAKNTESLSGDKTLTDSSEPVQVLTPDAARDVNLPAEASTNPIFIISNPSGSGFTLTVKDDSPATITTVGDGETKIFVSDGTGWYAPGGLANLVEDTTPQLGGDLDLNGNNIDFPTTPNISDCLDEDNMASDSATSLATQQSIKAYADTKIANVVEDTTPQLGGDLDLNSHNIDFPTTPNVSDCLDEDNMASDSATSLATQQSIKAYVDTQVATKIGNVVEDTTPQLGGDLDLNGNNIDFPTTPNISDCLDEDNMASDSATALATQQSIKAYADTMLPLAGGTMSGDLLGGQQTLYNFEGEINAQTGTTYTLLSSDNGKIVTLNNAASITLTVGSALPAGFNCLLIQKGAGQVTIAAGGTGNIRNRSSYTKIAGQYGMGTVFVESNAGTAPEVYIQGDLTS